MLGIDYNRLEEMVSRMESVAASMDESSKRVHEAAKMMETVREFDSAMIGNPEIRIQVDLDGQKIAEAVKNSSKEKRARG